MLKRLLPALVLCACLPAAAFAQPTIHVTGGWIRLLPGDLPLAGYFTLHNGGAQAIKLVGASGPGFARIQLHRSMTMHGMDKMVPVPEITVPAGKTFAFAPGGYHLMLWRNGTLNVGENVPITLKFADGRKIEATFVVKSAAGG
jgi:copper(I)-binding protein